MSGYIVEKSQMILCVFVLFKDKHVLSNSPVQKCNNTNGCKTVILTKFKFYDEQQSNTLYFKIYMKLLNLLFTTYISVVSQELITHHGPSHKIISS